MVQHDRVFSETFSILEVLDLMEQHPLVRYVGFQTVADYMSFAAGKYGSWVRSGIVLEPQLLPCFMWYDSTHVCRSKELSELIKREVKEGEFIESSYGCRLLVPSDLLSRFF